MKSQNRKLIWASVGVLITTVALVLLAGFPVRLHRGITSEKMREKVTTELPLGSSAEKVLVFLDVNHIEHAPYSVERHDIGAIKRNVCLALLIECSIDMRFFFDDGGHLQRIKVEEGFTGL